MTSKRIDLPLTMPRAAKGAAQPSEPTSVLGRDGEIRITVSTRLTPEMKARLRRAAYSLNREKQDIIEAALDEYLSRHGIHEA